MLFTRILEAIKEKILAIILYLAGLSLRSITEKYKIIKQVKKQLEYGFIK
ncbi:MAG: hypothetical protein QW272_08055 [Candidatus Methanomethylicaceae archaeon]